MKKTFILIALAAFILAPLSVLGQLKYTSVNYMVSLPMSDTKDYTDNASWRGFGFETGKFVNDNIAIGFGASWNVFNENVVGESIVVDNTTVSGKQFRYINTIPLYINSSYYFGSEDSKVKPYAGIGLGTMYKNQRLEIGVYAIEDNQWHFALYPHAGLLFAMGPDAHINLDAKYHQAFAAGGSDAVSFLSINVGIHYIFF